MKTEDGWTLRPPAAPIAPPGLTCPVTPVMQCAVPNLCMAHEALTHLINYPAMDAFPINYDRPTAILQEEPPAFPFRPNDPWRGQYLKFLIPDDDDPTLPLKDAKYIRLSDDKESLLGTMKKDTPIYGLPLYLLPEEDNVNDPPPLLTVEQLQNFHPDSPLYARNQEVLDDLQSF
jgi:hypothetical protein